MWSWSQAAAGESCVGAFSVIVQPVVEPMDRFTALEETVKLLCAGLGWAGLGAAGTFFNKLQQAGRQPPLSPLSSTSSILHPDWLHTSPPQVAELRLVGTKCPGALLAGVARLRSVNFELGPVKPVLATKLPAAAAR